jgi:hypothetical protein
MAYIFEQMEGLWTAEFGSSAGVFGGGVAIFHAGRILGGDATHYYVGEYVFSGNDFKATLKIYPFMEGAESVFRTVGRDLTLDLEGSLTDEGRAIAQGHLREMPDIRFGAKLTRRKIAND